jgi:hypothetical protein
MSAEEIRALLEQEKKEIQELEERLRKKEKEEKDTRKLIRALNETRQRKEAIKRKLECGDGGDGSVAQAPPASKRAAQSTTTHPLAVSATSPSSTGPPPPTIRQQTVEQQQQESRSLARQTGARFQHQLHKQQQQGQGFAGHYGQEHDI